MSDQEIKMSDMYTRQDVVKYCQQLFPNVLAGKNYQDIEKFLQESGYCIIYSDGKYHLESNNSDYNPERDQKFANLPTNPVKSALWILAGVLGMVLIFCSLFFWQINQKFVIGCAFFYFCFCVYKAAQILPDDKCW